MVSFYTHRVKFLQPTILRGVFSRALWTRRQTYNYHTLDKQQYLHFFIMLRSKERGFKHWITLYSRVHYVWLEFRTVSGEVCKGLKLYLNEPRSPLSPSRLPQCWVCSVRWDSKGVLGSHTPVTTPEIYTEWLGQGRERKRVFHLIYIELLNY